MMILVCLSHVRLQHSGACTSRREEASSRIASSFSASKDFFFFLSFASKRARIILDTSSLLHRWPPRALNFFRLSSYFYIYFLVPLFAFPLACLLLLFFRRPRDCMPSCFPRLKLFVLGIHHRQRGERERRTHGSRGEKATELYSCIHNGELLLHIKIFSFFCELFVVFSMSVSTDDVQIAHMRAAALLRAVDEWNYN